MFVLVRSPQGKEEIVNASSAHDLSIHQRWEIVARALKEADLKLIVDRNLPGATLEADGKMTRVATEVLDRNKGALDAAILVAAQEKVATAGEPPQVQQVQPKASPGGTMSLPNKGSK